MRNCGELGHAREILIREALSNSIVLPMKLKYKKRKFFRGIRWLVGPQNSRFHRADYA